MKPIGFVNSATVVLTKVCRESCGYCSFHEDSGGLLPLGDLLEILPKIRSGRALEVVLVTGESPQEYPHIQIALKREECHSFSEYLEKACRTVLGFDLLPVPALGHLDSLTAKTLAECACSVRIDLAAADLNHPGQAHENARRRDRQAGRESIQHAHEAGLPYHLGLLIGIGESAEERLSFIQDLGRFCASDPYLQDIRVIPFQPCPGTPMHDRPPLALSELSPVIRELKIAFPVHQISISPGLCTSFHALLEEGINDLGSLAADGEDPVMPLFPSGGIEAIAGKLLGRRFVLKERLPLTTNAGLKRPTLSATLDACRYRLSSRGRTSLDLVDDSHCFVCGNRNPEGMHLTFQVTGPFSCSTQWTPTKNFQGYTGITHGGILSTLLDEIMAQCLILGGIRVVTADMSVRFLRPAPLGIPFTVSGVRVGGRRHLHLTRGTIRSADGVVFAESEGRYIEC